MRDLVVFYSYSGHGAQDARWLAAALGADVAGIVEEDPRPPGGAAGFRCILDSLFRRQPPIRPLAQRAADYDRVILVCPVWAGRMAGPARTWVAQEGRSAKRLALLVQSGSGRIGGVVKEVAALAGRQPEAVVSITEADIKAQSAEMKVAAFARQLASA